ncbi:MAG TPA: hypothetical protein ENF18_03645 [candidate division WOR-3 bacterium]|uniref:EGF-like domain-containing protein n=1 Tax=candidate division WOR-3 bacterium TaxID=2052148 RepID=A0A7C0Z9H4_UNCW3|nr:hypothetical protein [candidate division WOR-3 bacterium]
MDFPLHNCSNTCIRYRKNVWICICRSGLEGLY